MFTEKVHHSLDLDPNICFNEMTYALLIRWCGLSTFYGFNKIVLYHILTKVSFLPNPKVIPTNFIGHLTWEKKMLLAFGLVKQALS